MKGGVSEGRAETRGRENGEETHRQRSHPSSYQTDPTENKTHVRLIRTPVMLHITASADRSSDVQEIDSVRLEAAATCYHLRCGTAELTTEGLEVAALRLCSVVVVLLLLVLLLVLVVLLLLLVIVIVGVGVDVPSTSSSSVDRIVERVRGSLTLLAIRSGLTRPARVDRS